MALADYQPERFQVSYKGKPLAKVRGLSSRDLSVLVRANLPELMMLYDRYSGEGATVNDFMTSQSFLVRFLSEAPQIAVQLICMAADEGESEEAMSAVALMSMPLQVQILIEIVRMTFEDVGGPKAFAAMVRLTMETAKTNIAADQKVLPMTMRS